MRTPLRSTRADGTPLTLRSPIVDVALVSSTMFAGFCQGRLTLTTAVPVTTADVTAAGTIYFTPYQGNLLALYDGSTKWTVYPFTEISLALTVTSGKNYDVYVYDNAGTPTLELSAAWTTDTARADAFALQNGVAVKSGTTTRRLVGTIRASGTDTTEDSAAKRWVANVYPSTVRRPLRRVESTATWVYNTDAWQQANASTTNQLDYLVSLSGPTVFVELIGIGRHSTAVAVAFSIGIGDDSLTAAATDSIFGRQSFQVAGQNIQNTATMSITPAVGRHFAAWLERGGGGAATTTMVGNEGGAGAYSNSGLVGWIDA
mgnify:CR=1 FL=1